MNFAIGIGSYILYSISRGKTGGTLQELLDKQNREARNRDKGKIIVCVIQFKDTKKYAVIRKRGSERKPKGLEFISGKVENEDIVISNAFDIDPFYIAAIREMKEELLILSSNFEKFMRDISVEINTSNEREKLETFFIAALEEMKEELKEELKEKIHGVRKFWENQFSSANFSKKNLKSGETIIKIELETEPTSQIKESHKVIFKKFSEYVQKVAATKSTKVTKKEFNIYREKEVQCDIKERYWRLIEPYKEYMEACGVEYLTEDELETAMFSNKWSSFPKKKLEELVRVLGIEQHTNKK